MRILAIIPARKGSRRLPNKNRKILNGKPLIEWTIDESNKSKYITDTIVTTDDEIIYNLCKYHDVIADRRSPRLCKDNTPMEDVIEYIQKKYKYDIYVLLHATTPLRNHNHIDRCIEVLMNDGFDTVVSVKELAPYIYRPNGGVYVFKDKLWTQNLGFVLMSKEKSIDIDTSFDFKLAEVLMNEDIRNEF